MGVPEPQKGCPRKGRKASEGVSQERGRKHQKGVPKKGGKHHKRMDQEVGEASERDLVPEH